MEGEGSVGSILLNIDCVLLFCQLLLLLLFSIISFLFVCFLTEKLNLGKLKPKFCLVKRFYQIIILLINVLFLFHSKYHCTEIPAFLILLLSLKKCFQVLFVLFAIFLFLSQCGRSLFFSGIYGRELSGKFNNPIYSDFSSPMTELFSSRIKKV